jgi:hypothetical protein
MRHLPPHKTEVYDSTMWFITRDTSLIDTDAPHDLMKSWDKRP